MWHFELSNINNSKELLMAKLLISFISNFDNSTKRKIFSAGNKKAISGISNILLKVFGQIKDKYILSIEPVYTDKIKRLKYKISHKGINKLIFYKYE